jgi:hypothetical protein
MQDEGLRDAPLESVVLRSEVMFASAPSRAEQDRNDATLPARIWRPAGIASPEAPAAGRWSPGRGAVTGLQLGDGAPPRLGGTAAGGVYSTASKSPGFQLLSNQGSSGP